jgi:DNA invertase Pin-like site-specific DNA recombinase
MQFIKENLTFTGDELPMANLMLSVLGAVAHGAVAQFERDLIRERQREGIGPRQTTRCIHRAQESSDS